MECRCHRLLVILWEDSGEGEGLGGRSARRSGVVKFPNLSYSDSIKKCFTLNVSFKALSFIWQSSLITISSTSIHLSLTRAHLSHLNIWKRGSCAPHMEWTRPGLSSLRRGATMTSWGCFHGLQLRPHQANTSFLVVAKDMRSKHKSDNRRPFLTMSWL